jgi:hypothetical protein
MLRPGEHRDLEIADSSFKNAVNFSSARVAKRFPFHRIALESFLIAGWRMIRP